MDSVQQQVASLSEKVDALQHLIEQLSGKLEDSHAQPSFSSGRYRSHSSKHLDEEMVGYQAVHHQSAMETEMGHKDILADVELVDTDAHFSDHQALSPDIQIQRLTAQLTAAYNRIAALEDQLLAKRVHSPASQSGLH